MSLKNILNEDWSEYDNRKIRDKRDGNFFSCEESWEVDYLKNKIKKQYSSFSDKTILDAISACCNSTRAPRPRAEFVECVAKRLNIPF